MATYKIVRRIGDVGLDVSVVGIDGAKQTILNFQTEAEAEGWIIQDEQLDRWRSVRTPPYMSTAARVQVTADLSALLSDC
jgi:hypothetical protein